MNLDKKYDVSFIGTMKKDDSRYELIKYLKENGIIIMQLPLYIYKLVMIPQIKMME